eukprot:4061864-Amphidinium_carterae.1
MDFTRSLLAKHLRTPHVNVDEGLQTVVHQWQTAAAQQMQVAQQETRLYRDMHSNQLLAIQRSFELGPVSPATVTSREELLRQELRQAQHRTVLQEHEAQANACEAARYYQALVTLNQNASSRTDQGLLSSSNRE